MNLCKNLQNRNIDYVGDFLSFLGLDSIMYCSDKQFIAIANKTGVESADMYEMIYVVCALHATWWSLIKSERFKQEVAKEHIEIVKMIELLESVDKADQASLKRLLVLIQDTSTKSFTIVGSTHEMLEEKLKKSFGDVEFEHESSQEPWLQVSWDGWWYKRSLAKDLDKILQ